MRETNQRTGNQQMLYRAWLKKLEWAGWTVAILITVLSATTYGLRAELARDAEQLISQQSQASWSNGQKRRYNQFISAALPPMSGILSLPTASTSVPIFAEESETAMTLGAAHLQDTAALTGRGNIVLSAHRDGPFRALKQLRIGDPIVLHSKDQQRTFRIAKISIVQPDAVAVLAPSQTTQLTLITCYPFYFIGSAPERFVVQAILAEVRNSSATTQS